MVDRLNVSWNILPLSPYWCYIDARQHHSSLFISLLANVQTLENKVDELKARMTFRWYIKVCNFFFFYWHMDGSLSPWLGYCDLSVHLQDWTKESSKQNGGEVYIMTNRRWCVDVHVVLFRVLFWSWIHHDQMQTIYLPREFTAVFWTAAYIPPHTNIMWVLDKLNDVIDPEEAPGSSFYRGWWLQPEEGSAKVLPPHKLYNALP